VLGQVATNSGHILRQRNAHLGEVLGRADARQHQQLRRVEGPARQDRLARARGADFAADSILDTDRAAVFDQNLAGQRAGHHCEVRAAASPA
jgi:hypothetical protein